jgi:NOL1/NOP2/fmu family ribosome biogenesis protein
MELPIIKGDYKLILVDENSVILDTYKLEGIELNVIEIAGFADQIANEIAVDMKSKTRS